MPLTREQVIPLLERDVARTLGEAHRSVVADTAANVAGFGGDGEKVVDDVQQHFHDTFVDTRWPACPLHGNHPLWHRGGAWWCERDQVPVARLGELPATAM